MAAPAGDTCLKPELDVSFCSHVLPSRPDCNLHNIVLADNDLAYGDQVYMSTKKYDLQHLALNVRD